MASPFTNDERATLRQFLAARFSLDELKTLSFDLGVSHDQLQHETIDKFAAALIEHFEHRDQLRALITAAIRQRPDRAIAQLLARLPAESAQDKVQLIVQESLPDGTAGLLQDLAVRLKKNIEIITPTEIKNVAWEGELVSPTVARGDSAKAVVTIGQPEIWNTADALKTQVGQDWSPPMGLEGAWLVRLACTLRNPAGTAKITEATQTLYLRPKNPAADKSTAYALSLFPDRLGVEDKSEFSAGLGPELKFGQDISGKIGVLGIKIEYRKVFPVIQGYGAGESKPYWIFKPHAAYPLEGTQFVYAVIATRPGADGARASVELIVTAETRLGLVRLGLPEEAKAHVSFTIPG